MNNNVSPMMQWYYQTQTSWKKNTQEAQLDKTKYIVPFLIPYSLAKSPKSYVGGQHKLPRAS